MTTTTQLKATAAPGAADASKPAYRLPAGAVDAHCHVLGPGSVFPYARGRKHAPADAPKEKLFALRDFLGFERNVIVQAACHGTDNRALVDALRSAADLVARWGLITTLPTVVVVDHLGRADVTQPLAAPDFGIFQRLMRDYDNVWAKLSGTERLSASGPPGYADFVAFARHLARLHPDRVLWGTDWPHPHAPGHPPDEGDLVDLIPRIAPTAELRRQLLVDNPMRLYWSD